MPGRFLRDDAKQALRRATHAVEETSAVEVVVSVRGTAASYLAVDLAVGAAVATVVLGFALLSPYDFSTAALLIDPLACGVVAGLACSRLAVLHRVLVPSATRRRWARIAAQSLFVERGVSHTRDRTGILIYLALTEGLALIQADVGVRRAVPADELAGLEAELTGVIARGGDALALAARLEAAAPVLARYLPRRLDDANELGDEVDG